MFDPAPLRHAADASPAGSKRDDLSKGSSFIRHLGPQAFAGWPAIYRCHFHPDAFNDALFSRFRIDPPASILDSAAKRRREYLAGRLCAAEALRALGHDCQVPIGPGGSPQWPQSVVGSISHSTTQAVAICVPRDVWNAVGVDIEPIMPHEKSIRLAHMILQANEIDLLSEGVPGIGLSQIATLGFSAKESCYKALFPQVSRRLGFDGFWIVRANADTQRLWLVTANLPTVEVAYMIEKENVVTMARVRT